MVLNNYIYTIIPISHLALGAAGRENLQPAPSCSALGPVFRRHHR